MYIENVKHSEEKAKIVKEVLLDLLEWLGLAESTASYVNESKDLPLLVAKENDQVLGFITLKETSNDACEIHCMGIKKD